jgi:hypothetical protein
MAFFDFLRPKRKQYSSGEALYNDPKHRSTILTMQANIVEKQVETLVAVGRTEEAVTKAAQYVGDALKQWTKDTLHPEYLLLAAVQIAASHRHGAAISVQLGFIIEAMNLVPHTIDLTKVYFAMGGVFQRLQDEKQKLTAYHMAAEAKAPQGCEHPATVQQKALAHFQARESAYQVNDTEKYEWHRMKLATLVAGTDLNDMMAFIQFTRAAEF